MKEKLKKFSEKFKNIAGKISEIKGITAIIPAVCLAVLMITVLTGYQTPKAKKYNAAETDISQIKEALANESTTAKATAATTKKNATKKGKKGAIDLKDGTYKGSANGYGGKVTVNVTISKKTMTAIDVVSAPGETDSFFSRAKGVIDEMLTAQSTDVDVVSGATYSSNGIIGAVKNALYGTESTNATAASANSNAGGSAPSVSKVKESGNWKDGTYTGSGKGFGGNISVKVTIKDGKISSINVTSASGETASYFSKAKGIIPKMISNQTTNVDAASGATYSSNGIIKAVRNALSKAGGKTSTTKEKKKKKKKKDKKSDNKNNSTAPKEGYEDGTYTGTAVCSGEQFKEYSVTANVTIKGGKISAVEITSTAKGTNLKQFMSREEIKNLPALIVSKNGTGGVDAVSGATYSSNAIFSAVNNALAKAKKGSSSTKKEETTTAKKEETTTEKKEETTTEKKEETTTEKKEDTTTEEDPDDGEVYKNGTYKVSVTCEPDEDEDFDAYTISMEVTIKKDKITDISNITANTNSSNKAYTNTAKKGMVSKITAKGTADGVDTVSGATCSSKAIKEGCQKAFDAARK